MIVKFSIVFFVYILTYAFLRNSSNLTSHGYKFFGTSEFQDSVTKSFYVIPATSLHVNIILILFRLLRWFVWADRSGRSTEQVCLHISCYWNAWLAFSKSELWKRRSRFSHISICCPITTVRRPSVLSKYVTKYSIYGQKYSGNTIYTGTIILTMLRWSFGYSWTQKINQLTNACAS